MTSTAERTGEVVHLPPERWRESFDLFMSTLHMHPVGDERWEQVRGLYHQDRVYGVYDGGNGPGGDGPGGAGPVVGTLMYSQQQIALPGGHLAPAYCGTAAGVRADQTRRGVFGRMVTTRLRDMAERGEALLLARPSTADLWQRWGTGPAARAQAFRIDRLRARLRPELVHRRERVRRLAPDTDLPAVLPVIQRRAAVGHPGTVARSDAWWVCWNPHVRSPGAVHAAVTDGPDGPDGYVTWYVTYEGAELAAMRRVVHVVELFAASPDSAVDLWCYLLSLELVEEIRALGRPLDEQVPLLLTDERACQVGEVLDELWLRVVDVAEALRLRGWAPTAGESVVLEVVDERLPHNTGCYRISSEGAERAGSARPDLSCSVLHLATMYLGDRLPSQLAAAGMLQAHDRAALPRADRLFATSRAPWGGSMF